MVPIKVFSWFTWFHSFNFSFIPDFLFWFDFWRHLFLLSLCLTFARSILFFAGLLGLLLSSIHFFLSVFLWGRSFPAGFGGLWSLRWRSLGLLRRCEFFKLASCRRNLLSLLLKGHWWSRQIVLVDNLWLEYLTVIEIWVIVWWVHCNLLVIKNWLNVHLVHQAELRLLLRPKELSVVNIIVFCIKI